MRQAPRQACRHPARQSRRFAASVIGPGRGTAGQTAESIDLGHACAIVEGHEQSLSFSRGAGSHAAGGHGRGAGVLLFPVIRLLGRSTAHGAFRHPLDCLLVEASLPITATFLVLYRSCWHREIIGVLRTGVLLLLSGLILVGGLTAIVVGMLLCVFCASGIPPRVGGR